MKPTDHYLAYSHKLSQVLRELNWQKVEELTDLIRECHSLGCNLFLCGNGGSAANAMHIANDFLYGSRMGIRAEALSANSAVITCLANDEGYDEIYAQQIDIKGRKGDLLLALSGSGNSTNIVNALKTARFKGMKTAAIVGYSGGLCKTLADVVVHAAIDDMQIAEDLQMMIGHMITQWLARTVEEVQLVKMLDRGLVVQN